MREAVPESVTLMFYGRVNGNSGRLVEYNEPCTLIDDGDVKLCGRFKLAAVRQSENYLVSGKNGVDTAYDLAVPGDAVLAALELSEEPF